MPKCQPRAGFAITDARKTVASLFSRRLGMSHCAKTPRASTMAQDVKGVASLAQVPKPSHALGSTESALHDSVCFDAGFKPVHLDSPELLGVVLHHFAEIELLFSLLESFAEKSEQFIWFGGQSSDSQP